jgi:hypothetical protein
VDQELNYFNYFTEIERFYQSKRESFTLLSTLDWVLIENWKEQGVPLDLVLKGIERAFSQPNRKRKINSLAYCVKAVEQICDEQKDLTVESPKAPDLGREEVMAYLHKLADEVGRIDEGVATSIRGLDSTDLRATEQVLSALEEKLIAKLKFTADDETMIQLKGEIDEELRPYRSTMTAVQLTMLEQQMWRRKLLERFDVPRLSLFYLL